MGYHALTDNRLNTLLDLKVENRRLQRMIMDYKSRVPAGSSTTSQSPTSQANPMYATSSLHPNKINPRVSSCQHPSNFFDQIAVASGSNFSLDFGETLYGSNASNSNLEETNEGSKKKKVSTDSIPCISFLNDAGTRSQRRYRVRSSMFVSLADAPTLLNGER